MKEASTRGSEESELCSVWVWLDRDSGGKGERAEKDVLARVGLNQAIA